MLGFNVKTFVTLLEALHGELERVTGGRAKLGACSDEKGMSLALTALVRRLLPAVRVYTSWLAASACLLVPELGDAALTSELKSLWTAYAKALTALVSAFPVQDLPSVGYLLEEDADTVGFKPFENKIARRWIHGDGGRRKPRRHDPAVDVLGPDTEMLARVRDILTDALQIVVVDKVSRPRTVATSSQTETTRQLTRGPGHSRSIARRRSVFVQRSRPSSKRTHQHERSQS